MKTSIIGWFPDPYPDESFYSICARFKTITGISNAKVITNLFGSAKISPSVEFLGRLSFTAQKLAWTGYYTEENIIQYHTLFPIYAPFITKNRRNDIKAVMLGNHGNRVQFLLGLAAKRIKKKQPLRYCPLCKMEDKHKFGTSYWHRLHQVRWILVCPIHKTFLKISPSAKIDSSNDMSSYFIAADEISAPTPEHEVSINPNKEPLQRIAEDFSWLLSNPMNTFEIGDIAMGYRTLLAERNLTVNKKSYVSNINLILEFKKFYSDKFLAIHDSSLIDGSVNWLKDFFGNTREAQIPIRHILLIHFLGFSINEFFQYIAFRKGALQTNCNKKTDYIARRQQANYKETFAAMWFNPSKSLREIGRNFGIDHKRVRKEAVRLGLPQTRSNEDAIQFTQLRFCKRNEWLSARKKHPDLDISALSRIIGLSTYKWLNDNDPKWLANHKPPDDKRGRKKRTDWHLVDREISNMIPGAAQEIINEPGRPVKAIQSRILRKIDKYSIFWANKDNLPKTISVLKKHIESTEIYYLRVIAWAVEYYSQEHVHCSKAFLFSRLHLQHADGNQKVLEAFEAAFAELEKREEEYYNIHHQKYPFTLEDWRMKKSENP
jgi:hypothetical protein